MKITVLTYNIHKGFNTFGTKLVLYGIRQSLRDTNADILFLQEVVGENQTLVQSHKEWPTESQFEFLADQVWPHFSYGKNAVFSDRHHGNAILSKFPIEFEENLNISNNTLEQRGLLHCKILVPPLGKRLHLFNTHIDLLAQGRKKQMNKINSRIENSTQNSEGLILAGDFNDWAHDIPDWIAPKLALQEAHTVLHGKPAKSFPCFLPALRLDRMYFRGLRPLSCRSLKNQPWSQLSDHLPLLAEFEFA